MNEYLNDEELLELIENIEKNELVKAPPMVAEKVFDKIDKKNQIIEYTKFRNRVIAAIACILVITFVVPEWMKLVPEDVTLHLMENEKKIDLAGSQIFGGLGNTHYISDYVNGREE